MRKPMPTPGAPNTLPAGQDVLRAASTPRGRAIALLRFVLYVLMAAAGIAAALWLLTAVFHVPLNVDSTLPMALSLLVQVLLVLATVIVPTAVMILFTREPAATFGWGLGHRLRHLLIGVIAGLGLMSLLIGLIAFEGGINIKLSSEPVGTLAEHGVGYAIAFVLAAMAEEGLTRGYAMVQLSKAFSFWPAAIVSSVLFVVMHLGHHDETPAGLLQVGVAGLVLAYSFWRSGALWFALGWHAAWDFAETYIFGVPDSGMPPRSPLLVSHLHGPIWLSGGSAGPEGSWLVFPVMGILALIVHFGLGRDRRAPAKALR